MDVRYINPFISSSRQVFDMMVHVPLKLEKPYVRQHGHPNYSVSAIIGISGGASGCVVLGFSQRVAIALASGLTNMQLTAIDADCVDALGEIVNMIAGSAKREFPGDLCSVSVPSVIVGSHQINYPSGVPLIVIPCVTPVGTFTIEVALEPKREAEGTPSEATAAKA